MNIRNLFEEKKCVFSFEMFPPKKNSDDINAMYETIDGLKRLGPDYISITYGAGGSGGRGTERRTRYGAACRRGQGGGNRAFGSSYLSWQRRGGNRRRS